MDRKKFIKSTALGLGALSFAPMVNASKLEAKNENLNELAQIKSLKNKEVAKTVKAIDPKIVKNKEGKLLNVLGDNQNIKLTGKDTNGQFTLIEQNNKPGVGIPPHVHENEDEVFQVIEGQVEMRIGEKTTTLNAGDLIFCPRGIPHSWKVIGEQDTRAMLSIFPAGLENMFEELAQLPPGSPDFEKVAKICGKYNLKFV
ncbi:cupin domain-containing protein [Lacinutrix sp. C3R15]|uniref:cupin domain-containing protein n=1 Tax=Flavobacteriaceae TaxID=49546 RepID=UPI001C0A66FB|nr:MULTISPECIES: cupin domain-containing protein [Flavobacteriaceae]MBU2938418.1 cupin domain-containing protein [Lacinutrix sp. C3R15]MDO6621732.1 cupin domain-containing protein [Oceanihabitans sp. 1_MG-2023]